MTDAVILLAQRGEPGSDAPVFIVTGLVLVTFWAFVGWAIAYGRHR
ncbi:hypothetical protein [Nocardia sp. NPDC051833]